VAGTQPTEREDELRPLKILGGLAVLAALVGCQQRAAAPLPPDKSQVEEGYRVAMYVCSECHIVAADQKVPPRQVPNGPTFMSIANRPDLTPQRLREHLTSMHATAGRPRHMPNFDFEIDEVIAYIRSLKTTP
jgi:mono/diheme cytochrome c family protein